MPRSKNRVDRRSWVLAVTLMTLVSPSEMVRAVAPSTRILKDRIRAAQLVLCSTSVASDSGGGFSATFTNCAQFWRRTTRGWDRAPFVPLPCPRRTGASVKSGIERSSAMAHKTPVTL